MLRRTAGSLGFYARYVDPAARGTGVGKKLLSQAKKLAVESDATGTFTKLGRKL